MEGDDRSFVILRGFGEDLVIILKILMAKKCDAKDNFISCLQKTSFLNILKKTQFKERISAFIIK